MDHLVAFGTHKRFVEILEMKLQIKKLYYGKENNFLCQFGGRFLTSFKRIHKFPNTRGVLHCNIS